MRTKEQPLAVRIQTDPCLREIAKLVGYLGIPMPINHDDYQRLLAKYDKQRLVKASEDLIEVDQEKKLATLKADVRKLCVAILGPAPEDWSEFYRGINNPPKNPYKDEPKQITDNREEIDIVAEAVADAIREETGMGCEVRKPDESEGSGTETEMIRSAHGRRLRQLLFSQHTLYQNYHPGNPIHEDARRRMDLIESEMRRRGNKVPSRPVSRESSNPSVDDEVRLGREQRIRNLPDHELLRRLARAKEVLACESEHTGIYRQSQIEVGMMENEVKRRELAPKTPTPESPAQPTFDVPGFRDFAKATTHRLRELLDMCQYELTRNDPDTVTHEEAVRDTGLIEAELRRREQGETVDESLSSQTERELNTAL